MTSSSRRHGPAVAESILREGQNSRDWVEDFVAAEKIDCDFRVAGRFHAAHNPAQYEALARKLEAQPKGSAVAAHMVPREEQRSELGTDAYFGGTVYERHAALDPGKFHQGLLSRVLSAGAGSSRAAP